MSDLTTNGPPAGWYQNPEDASQTRWWDGGNWTQHITPVAAPVSVPAPAPTPFVPATPAPFATQAQEVTLSGPGYNPYNPARDLAAQKNTAATTGLILAIISLFVNPLMLVGIGGLVWGIVGLSRASKWAEQGYEAIGKNKAIWAIVVSSVGTVLTIALKGLLF